MPAQEPLSQPGLIETLLWTRSEGYRLLDEHLARLSHSARVLGYRHDAARVTAALDSIKASSESLRVRLVVHHDGEVDVTAQALPAMAPGTVWRAAIAGIRLNSADPLLAHKTTRRDFYDDERARLAASLKADEALFLNERGEICEGGITTIFVPRDGRLLTPPLSRGLLPGVLRGYLIARGEAFEGDVRLEDLRHGFQLGNSVRGLIAARLVEPA
ncbi:MAG: aminotransferase class IV family protein [Rhizobiales bacterium]|nr:aminotransferase class IV family protein [Hyphomicrobiales bacterium]